MSYYSATAIRGLEAAPGSEGVVGCVFLLLTAALHEDCHRARSLQGSQYVPRGRKFFSLSFRRIKDNLEC